MAIPKDWSVRIQNDVNGNYVVSDVRAICPHCRHASTFKVLGQQVRIKAEDSTSWLNFHLVLACNSSGCREYVYVHTATRDSSLPQKMSDPFFMYPSLAIDSVHPSIPSQIAEDWIEAQRAMQLPAPKAAAVMCRRVLYGTLLDKGCILRPLHEELAKLINGQRLPAIFDQWLPAIKDDGHDAAHPDRALQVSSDNIAETMEYTSELLRFLYIEPYEFEQRKKRNTATD